MKTQTTPIHIQKHIECESIKENFIARYLKETGYAIKDVVLFEQKSSDGFTTKYWCEPKELSCL